MTPLLKKLLLVIAGIAALLILVAVLVPASGNNDTPAPTAEPVPEATITLVAGESRCRPNPESATIDFLVTLKNTGDATGETNVRPWRRYSDNEVNDSVVDVLTLNVPAGKERLFRSEFGYNAEEHALLECGLIVGDETEPTIIAVER